MNLEQRGIEIRIVTWQHVLTHFCQSTGNFHTGRTAAYYHNVEQLSALFFCGAGIGTLKGIEQSITQTHGLVDGLHRHGLFLQTAVTKVIGSSAGSKDKIVVVELANGGLNYLVLRIYGTQLTHSVEHILAAGKHLAEREGNGAYLQTGSGNLVNERRELMEIVLVDKNNLIISIFGKSSTQLKTAKTATYDNYAFFGRIRDIKAH